MQKKGTALEWAAVGIAVLLCVGGVLFVVSLLLQRTGSGAPAAAETTAQEAEPAAQDTATDTGTPVALITSSLLDDESSAPEAPAEETPESTPTSAPTATPEPLPSYEPLFESASCPMDTPAGAMVDCGYLTVPEDRTQPDGRQVRLAVAILRSTSPTPAPDPIIYLEGGPGGTALNSLDVWVEQGFLTTRDMIVFSQRGSVYAEPSLNCPEVEDWTKRYMGSPEGFIKSQMLRCHSRLVEGDLNLRMYNSANSAADIEDLRRALGYEQINLLGISYGTRLALTAMRDAPDHVRSVVLDSTYPPNVDSFAEHAANAVRAYDMLFDGCAADPACNAAFPNLKNDFYNLVAELNAEPFRTTVDDPMTGQQMRVQITGNDVAGLLFLSLYHTEIIPELPQVFAVAANGEYDLLVFLVQLATLSGYNTPYNNDDWFSEGMYYSVQCREEYPFTDEAEVRATRDAFPEFEDYFVDGYKLDGLLCGLWRVGEADSRENQPVHSDIPTLILAGSYDPITPPAWGMRAAETLSSSYFYEFPGYGHGVSVLGGCPTSITQAFLDNPTVAPDGSCIAGIGTPTFTVPGAEGSLLGNTP